MTKNDLIEHLNDNYALPKDSHYNNWYCRISKIDLDVDDKITVLDDYETGKKKIPFYLVKITKAATVEIKGNTRLDLSVETNKGIKLYSSNGVLKFVLYNSKNKALFPLFFFYEE